MFELNADLLIPSRDEWKYYKYFIFKKIKVKILVEENVFVNFSNIIINRHLLIEIINLLIIHEILKMIILN
jgi:hypothetical protein